MPLKGDAKKVMKSMKDQYGEEKGEEVFYATANKENRKPETWEKKGAAQKLAAILRVNSARRRPIMASTPAGVVSYYPAKASEDQLSEKSLGTKKAALKRRLSKQAAVGSTLRRMLGQGAWVGGGGAAGAGTGYALDPDSPESAATLGALGALSGTRGLRHQYAGGDYGQALRAARKGRFDDPIWNLGGETGTFSLTPPGQKPITLSKADDLARIEAVLGPRASNRSTWALTAGLGSKVGLGGLSLAVGKGKDIAENVDRMTGNIARGTEDLEDVTEEARGTMGNLRRSAGQAADVGDTLQKAVDEGLPIRVSGGIDPIRFGEGRDIPWKQVAKWGGGAALGGLGLYGLYRLLSQSRGKRKRDDERSESPGAFYTYPKTASALNPAELFLPEGQKKTAKEKTGSVADILKYTLGGAGVGGLGYGGYGAYKGQQSYEGVRPLREALFQQQAQNFGQTELEPETAGQELGMMKNKYLSGAGPAMWREFKPHFGKGALIGGGAGLGAALLKNLLEEDEPEDLYLS